uniref:Uncharacterized protein n=1 Tax=mine drainage metagenome TaxID=410659 RepID=E6QMZ2_9ZZZZ
MGREVVHVDAPVAWASALVNRDWSGLSDDEKGRAREWLSAQEMGEPVSVGEPFIGRFDGLVTEMATYAFLVDREFQERKS